jgi:hypothetical protein
MRFTKAIKTDPQGISSLVITDSTNKNVVFSMTEAAIISLIDAHGEATAKNTIATIVGNIYPDLTAEEINEIFS